MCLADVHDYTLARTHNATVKANAKHERGARSEDKMDGERTRGDNKKKDPLHN